MWYSSISLNRDPILQETPVQWLEKDFGKVKPF